MDGDQLRSIVIEAKQRETANHEKAFQHRVADSLAKADMVIKGIPELLKRCAENQQTFRDVYTLLDIDHTFETQSELFEAVEQNGLHEEYFRGAGLKVYQYLKTIDGVTISLRSCRQNEGYCNMRIDANLSVAW